MGKWHIHEVLPEHFERAARRLANEGLPKGYKQGRLWEVKTDHGVFPPKALCALAYEEAGFRRPESSEFMGHHNGGWHDRLLSLGVGLRRRRGTKEASASKRRPSRAATSTSQAARRLVVDIESILANRSLSDTQRVQSILARVGQGLFRQLLRKERDCCALTGVGPSAVLRASHIQPWSAADTALMRLHPDNGLLLSANVDALFDAGLIGFDRKGRLLLSSKLKPKEVKGLHLSTGMPLGVELSAERRKNLAWHLKHRFQGPAQ